MELRRLTICMALFVLGISHCSEAYSRHRRQALDDVNYDDPLQGDEANEYDTLNDTEQSEPRVETPAIIETTPRQYEVEAGADVRLECKVTPEKGTVMAWYKNNEQYSMGNIKMHDDSRYSIAEGSKDLIIKNTQADDSGVFKCETVRKDSVPVAINHTLLVTQKPVIINMTASNNGILGVGGDLTITCYITASPVPSVLWSVTKKDQGNLRLTEKDADFHVEGNVYSIHIKNVKKENAGQYYCYAINKRGSHQAETNVVVNGKPQVHVPKTIVNSDIKIEAVLQCSAHGETRPYIRWYKDGVLIEDSTKYVISTRGPHSNLTVSPSVDGDFGTFTCEAENSYGTHNRSIDLVQRPVVEDLDVDGPRMTWTVHSHQPLEEMEVQLKPTSEDGEWTKLSVPVPEGKHHKYDISYSLEDKQLQPGQYLAAVKVKNSKSWGGTEPAVVTILVRANAAHSIRPVYTALSTILMYLLVRML